MTNIEDRLSEAFGSTAEPSSPDLFDRVVGSIADDRIRRRRRLVVGVGLVVVLTVLTLLVTLIARRNGDLMLPWWTLELATNAVLIALAFWLGPFIKRFGRAYAADVFHDNPMTGKSYIVLTDIVYYLIFAAYVLFTVNFEPADSWGLYVTAAQVKDECMRLGGILLIIGVLHGANLVLLPVLGRLFSMNRRFGPRPPGDPSVAG
ncbi:MAG TPA: hypothetical protein VIT41_00110 [Microlunatus sp.]